LMVVFLAAVIRFTFPQTFCAVTWPAVVSSLCSH
jgi:hypothetical protein